MPPSQQADVGAMAMGWLGFRHHLGMTDDLARFLKRIDAAVLGARLRDARLARGMKQADVVTGHASVPFLSRIESGQRKPDLSLLTAMADRLSLSVDELLIGVSDTSRAADQLQLDHAEMALRIDSPERARELASDLLERLQGSIDSEMRIKTQLTLAAAHEAMGDLDSAVDSLEGVMTENFVDLLTTAQAATALTRCYRDSGDLNRAINVGETATTSLREAGLGDSDEALELLATTASAYFERGDAAYAVRLLKEGARRAEGSGSPRAQAAMCWNAAVIQAERGDPAGALPLAERALSLLQQADRAASLPRIRAQLAAMQLSLDPPPLADAMTNLERALEELQATGAPAADLARTYLHLAKAQIMSGDLRRAEVTSAAGAEHAAGLPSLAAEAHALSGRVHMLDGDHRSATRAFEQAALAVLG